MGYPFGGIGQKIKRGTEAPREYFSRSADLGLADYRPLSCGQGNCKWLAGVAPFELIGRPHFRGAGPKPRTLEHFGSD
jgi:hypothetical protein